MRSSKKIKYTRHWLDSVQLNVSGLMASCSIQMSTFQAQAYMIAASYFWVCIHDKHNGVTTCVERTNALQALILNWEIQNCMLYPHG
jgi:hypothetical protein